MKILILKILRYLKEIRFCFKIGYNLKNNINLAISAIKFHFINFLNKYKTQSPKIRKIRNYKIKLNKSIINIQLRSFSGDLFEFFEVLMDEIYFLPLFFDMQALNIVDLGAHIGLTTLFLSKYFPLARFICVEPHPENIDLLINNLSYLKGRVSIVKGAIDIYSGEKMFDISGETWQGKLSTTSFFNCKKIHCITMKEIIARFDLSSIDILKVDIEGAEKYLFKRNNDWLRQVKVILIELHYPYSLNEFKEDIYDFGFKVFPPASALGNRIVTALSHDFFRGI